MPLYCYECPEGHAYEEALPLKDYDKKTKCPKCKKVGHKVIRPRQSAPTFSEKLFPYFDPNLDKVCHSKADRERRMKELGVHSLEGRRSTTWKQERYLLSQRLHNKPQM